LATAILEHENPTGKTGGGSRSSTVENAALAETRIMPSYLSRLHPEERKGMDRMYAVTPNFHVESSHEESFELQSPEQPDLAQSPFVLSAVKALAKASRNALRQSEARKDK
jgi:hypothetical protein